MKKSALVGIIALSTSALLSGVSGTAHAGPSPTGMPSQSQIDRVSAASDYAGLWGDVTGGVAGRPYVTDLSVTVTPADGSTSVSRTFITGGTVSTPASATPGDITMVITPYNVCNAAKGQKPAAGVCYANPNRLGAAIGYVVNEFGIGTNFSNPTDDQGTPISTPLLDLIKNPANTTTFDVKINMSTWGNSLRWTWMNGEPTFWNVNPIAQDNAVVHLKFNLTTGPSEMCDTAIPVRGCDPAQRGPSFAPRKILATNFVMSLDETGLDSMFAGTLFASTNADIGSLEAQPVGSPTLGLTYGVSGSNELDGVANVAKFYAFVADSSLVNYFGVTQETLDSPDFAGSETLKVNRADGGTSDSTAWTRWSADKNGTSGYFLTVSGVRFDGTVAASGTVGTSALKATKAAKFVMGKSVSNAVSVRRSGTRQVLSASSTTKLCKKNECRWVISRSTSKTGAMMKRLATVTTPRGSSKATASVKAAKGSLLSAMLQAKRGGKWVFVTSRMVVGQ